MSGFPLPRFAVPASDRPSYGSAFIETAEALGVQLLPWQEHVGMVALEHQNGHLAFRDVAIGIPRQSGKTTLLEVLILFRMLSAPGQRIAYGAQSRLAARSKLFDTWWPHISRSPLRDLFDITRATGAESLRSVNGSILTLLSSEESSAHGESLDLAILDECWALEPSAETAVRPALATRRNGQLWMASTAGTDRSVFWRSKVDSGRATADTGLDDGVAYFEWSAPDDADPGDPAVWRGCMPALGATIDESTIAHDLAAMPPAEFRRSHLNQWGDEAGEGWNVISFDDWKRATRGD